MEKCLSVLKFSIFDFIKLPVWLIIKFLLVWLWLNSVFKRVECAPSKLKIKLINKTGPGKVRLDSVTVYVKPNLPRNASTDCRMYSYFVP